ncbi:MAG: hypothetical protein K0A89_07850 [ANME-2 cluster archaeon]|nr:hypothetical protein [ANME-2 cluster archaeon]MCL7474622.1 hypothetical protein [ANME-2 cluster archaeon]MDF1531069.1 hypothetical protein [ANME-2 cluster archaeon]MDW7775524.1 hypothetical protein [Methanosarcinales archaeon]
MSQIYVKDSIIEAQIRKEMILQRLYGNKEAIETHLSLCEDDTLLHEKLMKILEYLDDEILMFKSEE